MYQILTLSSDSQKFISELTSGNKTRTLPVSIAIARVIANEVILPSTEVDNITTFFNVQAGIDCSKYVSDINEILPIDSQCIMDLIVKFYNYRYNSAYPCSHILAVKKETAIVDFFRISKVFDETTLDVIKENCVQLTELVAKFLKLITELKNKDSNLLNTNIDLRNVIP